jgi:hypothetical protein
MDFEDILYFDYTSGDDITLNLNYPGEFLWYSIITHPVTFTFLPRRMIVSGDDFELEFFRTHVKITTLPSREFQELNISLEDMHTIKQGIFKLLGIKRSHPNMLFVFDPKVLRKRRYGHDS